MAEIGVLFVCLGNICRSPMAEGVFRSLVKDAGLSRQITIDSAGTSGWHEGGPADERAIEAATKRGFDLTACVSRPVEWGDYSQFNYLLAMDAHNEETLRHEAPDKLHPRIFRFMSFAQGEAAVDVPDPYVGGTADFDQVLDLIEQGAAALLEHIRRHDL